MNTNYSKIALLLALGVIAGDKVGAELNDRPLDELNTVQRKNLVKNEYVKGFSKTKENTTALRNIENDVIQIFSALGSANDHFLTSKNWVDAGGNIVSTGGFGAKILGIGSSAALVNYVSNNNALDNVRSKLGTLESNFDKDIKNIETKAWNSAPALEFFKIEDAGTAKGLKEFIDASQSKDKTVKNLVTPASDLITLLADVKVRSANGNQLLGDLAGMIERMTKKVSSLGNAPIEVTESGANKSTVEIRTGLDNAVNALKDLFANYSAHYADLSAVTDTNQEIQKMAKRHKVISDKLSKINFASRDGMTSFLNNFLSKTSSNLSGFKDTLDGARADAGTKKAALRQYLTDTFGEATSGLQTAGTGGRVFEYKNSGSGVAAGDGTIVAPSEVHYALGLSGSPMADFDGDALVSTSSEQPKVAPLYGFVNQFVADLATAATASAPTDGRTALKAFAKSDVLAQKPDQLDLKMGAAKDFTTVGQIKTYFSNNKTKAENLSKDNKAAFDASAPAWKTELTTKYNIVDQFLVRCQSGLSGNGTCDIPGTCSGHTYDGIETSRKEIKAAYDAAIAALGTPAAPAAEAPKTIDDLLNSDAFKKTSLKVTELSQEIRGLIASAKDQVAAQTLFAKILPGVPAADVEALKGLFAPEIKDKLVVKEVQDVNTDEDAKQKEQKAAAAAAQRAAEIQKLTLATLDPAEYLDSTTGELEGEENDVLVKFDQLLADALKSLNVKGKKPAALNKNKQAKAVSIINAQVKKFEDAYADESDDEDNEAKKSAVAAARNAITEIVNKAFGIKKTAVAKGRRAPAKRAIVSKKRRGNQIKRNVKKKNQKQDNKKNEKK